LTTNIKAASTEISEEEYQPKLHQLAERHWDRIIERKKGRKRTRNYAIT
jgi:hypothetical protein